MEQLEDLVAAYRILAEHGVIDAYGHVSLRSPRDPDRYYLARSIAPERVQLEDLIEYDLGSTPVGVEGRESVRERFIHGEIYRARPEVMAVVHNHSPSVVPFSVTGVPMRPIWHMAAFVGEGLPNFEIRDFQKGTDLLVKTPQLGQALARTLGAKPAALMRGHGSVVVGENLPRAVGRSVYLEISARMQMQAMAIAGPGGKITWFDEPEVREYLGKPKVWKDEASDRTDVPGVATGLAVTGAGGDVLFIEATAMDGEPGLTLTGQLGDVMKESALIALSYVEAHAEELDIDPAALKRKFHVHVPAGAIPKDGPSAGVAMLTALVSLLTGHKVKNTVGMTGEITLQGKVLPIGGVKQKVLAAHRAGLKEVIVPRRNEADLDDVPEKVREDLIFHIADRVDDVLAAALDG